MRALVLILALVLCGCSTPRSSVHYSPPSAAPVRGRIANAQEHVANARKAATNAKAATDLALKDGFIDQLTSELLSAQTALHDSQKELNTFETTTARQTTELNKAVDEKNAALLDRDREKRLAHKIAGERNKLFFLLSAALIWIFRTPLLWLVKFIASFITKLPI